MIFNERDQLEELELLTIFDMYQSSHDKADESSPKVKEKNIIAPSWRLTIRRS